MNFKAFHINELKMNYKQLATFLEVSDDDILQWDKTNQPPTEVLQLISKRTGFPFMKLLKYDSEIIENSNEDKDNKEELLSYKDESELEYVSRVLDSVDFKDKEIGEIADRLYTMVKDRNELLQSEDYDNEFNNTWEFLEYFYSGFMDELIAKKALLELRRDDVNSFKELYERIIKNEPDRISTFDKLLNKIENRTNQTLEGLEEEIYSIENYFLNNEFIINVLDVNGVKQSKDGVVELFKFVAGAIDKDIEELTERHAKELSDYYDEESFRPLIAKYFEPFNESNLRSDFNFYDKYETDAYYVRKRLKELEAERAEELNQEFEEWKKTDEYKEEQKYKKKEEKKAKAISNAWKVMAIINPVALVELGIFNGVKSATGLWKKDYAKSVINGYNKSDFHDDYLSEVRTVIQRNYNVEKFTLTSVGQRWEGYIEYIRKLNDSDEGLKEKIQETTYLIDVLSELKSIILGE